MGHHLAAAGSLTACAAGEYRRIALFSATPRLGPLSSADPTDVHARDPWPSQWTDQVRFVHRQSLPFTRPRPRPAPLAHVPLRRSPTWPPPPAAFFRVMGIVRPLLYARGPVEPVERPSPFPSALTGRSRAAVGSLKAAPSAGRGQRAIMETFAVQGFPVGAAAPALGRPDLGTGRIETADGPKLGRR